MKKNYSNIVLLFTLVFLVSFSYTVNGQILKSNNLEVKQAKYELALKNILRNLGSENHGVRISAVELVGRYKISDFENILIEMLDDEKVEKDKEVIALSLFQLGSLNSITTLNRSLQNSNDDEYKYFAENLLKKYNEYDKLRTEYFQDLVVNIFETK
jgi:HEAT repeat protein